MNFIFNKTRIRLPILNTVNVYILLIILNLSAASTNNANAQNKMPGKVHFGLIYPLSTNGTHASLDTNNLSFNLIGGISAEEQGLSFAGITFGWLKIAAVIMLVAGTWITYNIFRSADYNDLITNNQIITEKPPDGSEVTLNKNSQISYAKNFKDNRSIRLAKGNVFFSVAHDKPGHL